MEWHDGVSAWSTRGGVPGAEYLEWSTIVIVEYSELSTPKLSTQSTDGQLAEVLGKVRRRWLA